MPNGEAPFYYPTPAKLPKLERKNDRVESSVLEQVVLLVYLESYQSYIRR